jgi:hypothetical protein
MREDMRKRGSPSLTVPTPLPRRSLAVALQRPINVESHAGESITEDLMTKAW